MRAWKKTNQTGTIIYHRLDGPAIESDNGDKQWSYVGSSHGSDSAFVRAILLERQVYHLTKLVELLANKVEELSR